MCSHEGVQPAFRLFKTGPAPGPFILLCAYGPGARPATDAAKSALDQRIIGDPVLLYIPPNPFPRPAGKRVDFQNELIPERIKAVKFEPVDALPGSALVAAQPRDPRIEGSQALLK